jgi:HEPN/Toprim N-terminal domain 1
VGSYATLKVGSEELAWKYYVPPILAFLFAEDDFVAVPYEVEAEAAADPYAPPEDPGYDVLGYRTTREGAINNLEAYGYTLDFFARVYTDFYDELDAAARESVRSDMEFSELTDVEVEQYISEWFGDAPRAARQDIDEFVQFLRQKVGRGPQDRSLWGRFEDLHGMLMNRHREFSPATCGLLSSSRKRSTSTTATSCLSCICGSCSNRPTLAAMSF